MISKQDIIKICNALGKEENKEKAVERGNDLLNCVDLSFFQKLRFKSLLKNISNSDLKNEEYISNKNEMITMAMKSIDDKLNGRITKNTFGNKMRAGIGYLLLGFAPFAYGQEATPVNSGVTSAESSGVTKCPTPGVDYEGVAKQADDHLVNGRNKKAFELLKPYLKDPCNNSALFFVNYGFILIETGKNEEAEQVLLKASEISDKIQQTKKTLQDLHNNLGAVYFYTDRKTEALEEFKKEYSIDPKSKEAERAQRWLKKLKPN